ncbi:innexin unc-9-like [Mercenaria mercenaria]|uniref:innexin unc-9-like n=1 Tax=Mercenaria mercenaria TaxID=6596 RepID=UPI00234EA6D4|nr:innexin unc-9-like [Mercenaria mercenaria]
MEVLAIIPSFKRLNSSHCDDWVDRVNHVYTVMMLLVFAVLLSAAQYVGAPIYCWIPAELYDGHESYFKNYIHNYCWVKNTYYIPMFDIIPRNVSEREEEEITYYQWVPILLLLQAFLFKLPNILWKMLHEGSGINIDKLCKNAQSTEELSTEERKGAYEGLVYVIRKWISVSQPYHDTRLTRAKATLAPVFCLTCYKRGGTYLTGLYLIIKILYLANAAGQLFLLNDFITTDSSRMFGIEWIQSFQNKYRSEESPRFPRITLCDFDIRQMANIQRYTVQCVLPINLFNEKVYLFLWFWCLLVALLSFYNLLKWVYLTILKRNNYEFVKKYLKIGGRTLQQSDKLMCKKFAEKYLRDDGCFVARMISINSSDMVVTEMLNDMFQQFRQAEEPKVSENCEEPKVSEKRADNMSGYSNHIDKPNLQQSGATGNHTDEIVNRRNRLQRQNNIH